MEWSWKVLSRYLLLTTFQGGQLIKKIKGIWTVLMVILIAAFEVDKCFCDKYIPEFDDKQAFEISWLGPDTMESMLGEVYSDSIVMKTQDKEKYQCFLPSIKSGDEDLNDMNMGPHPEELLAGVLTLKDTKCSYRLEPYWTYEVCHGLHVRQFHEEKGPGPDKIKLQEYYLGKIIEEEKSSDENKQTKKQEETSKIHKVPKRDIDGRETPYYNFTMGNGTPCDINNNQPRSVSVMYICHPTSNNEIVSVKETTTCEYEVMVLTPELCQNPAYVVKDAPIHGIKCLPIDGAPSRPSRLVEVETNALEEKASGETRRITSYSSGEAKLVKSTGTEADTGKGGDTNADQTTTTVETGSAPSAEHREPVTTADEQLTRDFLSGDYCLTGGSGWWLFEFCYGKYVQQFHQDASGKTVIYLGYWDKEKHLEWIKKKKKFMSKSFVTHYYSNGDVCDLTGKPRIAQVKLKCMKDQVGQQIAIYMVEPNPCEYIVGIESPILCKFIENADSSGLFTDETSSQKDS